MKFVLRDGKMKNTLTIAITKYYTYKTDAETMDIAFDEITNTTPLNLSPARLRYKDMIIEPVEFNLKTTKKRKPTKGKK